MGISADIGLRAGGTASPRKRKEGKKCGREPALTNSPCFQINKDVPVTTGWTLPLGRVGQSPVDIIER